MASPAAGGYRTFRDDVEAGGAKELLRNSPEYRRKLERASFYVLEAFDGIKRQGVQDTPLARFAFRLHRKWLWITKLSAWLLVISTYFERPLWCNRDYPGMTVHVPCRNALYPSYEINAVSTRNGVGKELFFLTAIAVDLVMLVVAQGQKTMRGYAGPRIMVMVFYICDMVFTLHYRPQYFRLAPYLRITLAMLYSKDVLRKFVLILQSAPAVLNVFILGFALQVFFASAGTTLFKETKEGEDLFPDFSTSLCNLFKLITMGNFPSVMLPGYSASRPICVFFILYVVLMVFFLLPMLTAVIFNQYMENADAIKDEKEKIKKDSEELGFQALQSNGEIHISVVEDLCSEVVVVLNLGGAQGGSALKRAEAADKDGDGLISRSEFHALLRAFRKQRIDDAVVLPEVESAFPSMATNPTWISLKSVVTSPGLEAVLVTAFSITVLHGIFSASADFVYDVIFSAVFSIECVMKILVLGWHEYFKKSENNFDFWITVITASATASNFLPGLTASPSVVRTLSTFRLLRLMRLLNWIPGFSVLLRALGRALPEIGAIAKVLYCATFIFGVAGCQLFGGYINTDPQFTQKAILEASEFGEGGYYPLSFNDLPSSFVTLFVLLGQNDMFVLIEAYASIRGRWAWIYFIAWWIFGVVICLNIVVSFIIDAFVSEFQREKEQMKAQSAG